MKTFLWFIQSALALIGAVATYLPLLMELSGKTMWWGLAWQIWAMIGLTVLWVSMLSVILRLAVDNRRLNNEESRLRVRQLQLDVQRTEREEAEQSGKGGPAI